MKFNIGDKLHISGDITVTGANKCGDGIYSYNTDVGTFHEPALDKLVCKPASAEPVFSWDDFKAGKIAVHCDTEEKAKAFIAECKSRFPHECRNWETNEVNWDSCTSETTYSMADGDFLFADVAYDKKHGYTIIDYPFSAEPAKEPVKLYCVKDYEPGHWCTKGKIYEIDADGGITHDDGWVEIDFLPFMRRGGCICGKGTEWKKYLVPLVSRPAKAGEWVLPLADCQFGRYKKNQPLKVTKDLSNKPDSVFYNRGVVYEHPDCNAYVIRNDEYLTLDGYDGRYEQTDQPKLYGGKVVCVEAHFHLTNSFTAGKVYTFENGKVADNDGDARPLDDAMETLDEWNEEHGGIAKFIEYKGEAT